MKRFDWIFPRLMDAAVRAGIFFSVYVYDDSTEALNNLVSDVFQ